MGTVKLSGKPDKMLGGNLALDWHPIQGGVVLLLVVPCDIDQDMPSSLWVI